MAQLLYGIVQKNRGISRQGVASKKLGPFATSATSRDIISVLNQMVQKGFLRDDGDRLSVA